MGSSSMEVLYGKGDTQSPGHPNSLQKQKTQKQYAGEAAREPRNHKQYHCKKEQNVIV
jgi:hypothetical protein